MTENRIIREMHIRAYEQQDQERVLDIWIQCGLFASDARDQAFTELHVASLLPNGTVLVGELNGKIVATVYIATTGVSAWLWDLAVAPEFQGMNYGTDMLFNAEKWAKNQGVNRVMLFVLPHNEDVMSFYEKAAYKKMDYTVMAKDLLK